MSSYPWDWHGAWKITDTMNQTAPFLKGKRGGTESQDGRPGKTNDYLEWRKSYKRVREHVEGDPGAYPLCPKGAPTLNFHCLVQSNFKCLKQKALLPSGGYCKISQIIFAFYTTASSFVIVHLIFFVFSWYSTVPLDISVPSSNFFFLKAFVPLCCLLSRKEFLKNICGGCILYIFAGSASASRKGARFCWILQGWMKEGPQLLHYKRSINWQQFL